MFCPFPADVAQLVEQRFRNSCLANCTSFRCFAYRRKREVIGSSAFAARYIELRTFAAKTLQTVENDREILSLTAAEDSTAVRRICLTSGSFAVK
jgi:hypothetical protein